MRVVLFVCAVRVCVFASLCVCVCLLYLHDGAVLCIICILSLNGMFSNIYIYMFAGIFSLWTSLSASVLACVARFARIAVYKGKIYQICMNVAVRA